MAGPASAIWNEKVLTPLFIHARMEFLSSQHAQFTTARASDFAHFLTWAIEQARDNPLQGAVIPSEFTTKAPSTLLRQVADASQSGDGAGTSNAGLSANLSPPLTSPMATHLIFEHLSKVVHAKKKSRTEFQELSFEDRARLLTEKRPSQIVGMCYKWAKFLVRHKVPSSEFDIRAAQMFFLYGKLCNAKVPSFCEGDLRMPTKILKEYLQVDQMSEAVDDFESFLYIYALCHQQREKFIKPEKIKLAKGKNWGLITTGRIVTVLYKAWNCFAQYLGFQNLSSMVYPFMLIDGDTGRMGLVPGTMSVLSSCHSLELFLYVESDPSQSSQGSVGVSKDSLKAPSLVRGMSEEDLKNIRMFTRHMFNDLEMFVANKDVFEGFNGSTPDLLSMFVSQQGLLPSRFDDFSQFTKASVRSAVSAAKNDVAAGGVQLPPVHQVPMDTISVALESEVPVERHVCPVGCDCPELRRVIADEMTERYCAIVCSDFRTIMEAFEEGVIQVTPKSVQLILTDPPPCIEPDEFSQGTRYSFLEETAYGELPNLVFDLLRPGGHLILFCSAVQFCQWSKMFTKFTVPGKSGENAFLVDRHPLIMISENRDPLRGTTYEEVVQHSIVEYALHVVRRQDGSCNPTDMVQFEQHGHIMSTCAANTNVIDNIPSVDAIERLRWSEAQGLSARAPVIRVAQKSVPLFRELICRYSKPNDSVLDPFAGTFTTAIACLTVPIPRMFYGADVDKNCVYSGAERCLYEFTKRIVQTPVDDPHALRVSSLIRDKITVIYNRYFLTLDVNRPVRSMFGSSVALPHKDIPFIQTLPSCLRVHLASLTRNAIFTENFYERNGPDKWPAKAYAALSRSNMGSLQSAECARYMLMRSDLDYLICAGPKKVNDLLGYYYGTIVFVDLAQVSGRTVTYGGGIHSVCRDSYARHRVPVLNKGEQLMYNDIPLSDVYIAPAPYCPFHRVRISTENDESNAALFVKPTIAISSLLRPTHVSVRATKAIEPGHPIVLRLPPVFEVCSK